MRTKVRLDKPFHKMLPCFEVRQSLSVFFQTTHFEKEHIPSYKSADTLIKILARRNLIYRLCHTSSPLVVCDPLTVLLLQTYNRGIYLRQHRRILHCFI